MGKCEVCRINTADRETLMSGLLLEVCSECSGSDSEHVEPVAETPRVIPSWEAPPSRGRRYGLSAKAAYIEDDGNDEPAVKECRTLSQFITRGAVTTTVLIVYLLASIAATILNNGETPLVFFPGILCVALVGFVVAFCAFFAFGALVISSVKWLFGGEFSFN